MKSDSQLQHDVMAELEWDPIMDHADIGVSAVDGVITLNGFVKSYAEKMAAERAARRVSGVKAIAEELNVRHAAAPKTADHEIAKRILDVFQWSVLVPDDKISVKVEKGWVTLTGSVPWHFQAEEAKKTAGKISGVVGITNRIEVHPRADAGEIRHRIEAALKRQAHLDATSVTVATDGNKVTLGGKVKGWHERQAAERAAWGAPGVTQVEDYIAIG
jgi:osmotically-inducible protein OsmY